MKRALLVTSFAFFAALVHAENTPLLERDVLMGDMMGLRQYLSDSGIYIDTGLTNIYQSNVHGGLSTTDHSERFTGSYDIEINIDTEKLFGWEDGWFYILSEGSWNDGINDEMVGSYFGVNDDAAGDRSFDITELWYEHSFTKDGDLLLRIGKLDLTGGFECKGCPVAFDSSFFANDETSQFLNPTLVNNPTIPFPDNGLGAILFYSPADSDLFMAFGVADVQADARTTGFGTAFDGDNDFFYIFETGFTYMVDSKPGVYRVGLWHDHQPKAAEDAPETHNGDTGFYLTFDQKLTRESMEDNQGLGAFFRYGYAPQKTNDITQFFSGGLAYEGLLDGRDQDVFAIGYSRGNISNQADTTYPEDHESIYEAYYNIQITPAINITPSVQYIVNPGADNTADDAIVFAVRAQLAF